MVVRRRLEMEGSEEGHSGYARNEEQHNDWLLDIRQHLVKDSWRRQR